MEAATQVPFETPTPVPTKEDGLCSIYAYRPLDCVTYPPHLKAHAKRLIALERRQVRQSKKARQKRKGQE